MCLKRPRPLFTLLLLFCLAFWAFASDGALQDPKQMTTSQILSELNQLFQTQQENSAKRLESLEQAQSKLLKSQTELEGLKTRLTQLESTSKELQNSLMLSSQTLEQTQTLLQESQSSLASLKTEWAIQMKSLKTEATVSMVLAALGILSTFIVLTAR
nr:MAG TPA: Peptidoglycan endopeptidase [Bacteriophage sp.]